MRKSGLCAMMGLALAMPSALSALPSKSDAELLAEWQSGFGRPKETPDIPASLRAIIRTATPLRMTIAALNGTAISIDISEVEPYGFESFAARRFIGYSEDGYEYDGYIMVDRRMKGKAATIQTGARPSLSPNGRWMAAAMQTGAGFNGLEGLGVWEILPDRTVLRYGTSDLPDALDWRAEPWRGERCGYVSYVPASFELPPGIAFDVAIKTAPRRYLLIKPGKTVTVTPVASMDMCPL